MGVADNCYSMLNMEDVFRQCVSCIFERWSTL